MFKKLLLSLLFLLPLLSIAQEFNGGLVFGLSTSQISGDRLQGPNKAGIYAGTFVNLFVTERASLQMEMNFIQKGSRRDMDTLNPHISYLLRLNYIEIPIHYRYYLNDRFTVEAGLSYGYLINFYEEVNYSPNTASDKVFKKSDFSLSFGLYFALLENLNLNIRYTNSIFAVREHASGATYRLNKGQYNEVISFTFQYTLFSRLHENENIKMRE